MHVASASRCLPLQWASADVAQKPIAKPNTADTTVETRVIYDVFIAFPLFVLTSSLDKFRFPG